jgi:hypothetical protein
MFIRDNDDKEFTDLKDNVMACEQPDLIVFNIGSKNNDAVNYQEIPPFLDHLDKNIKKVEVFNIDTNYLHRPDKKQYAPDLN